MKLKISFHGNFGNFILWLSTSNPYHSQNLWHINFKPFVGTKLSEQNIYIHPHTCIYRILTFSGQFLANKYYSEHNKLQGELLRKFLQQTYSVRTLYLKIQQFNIKVLRKNLQSILGMFYLRNENVSITFFSRKFYFWWEAHV